MTDSNVLTFLFSTAAAIVATLTGLIGAFATFRLQRMDAKLDSLKDYILQKDMRGAKTLKQKLRDEEYNQIEKIYLHNMDAVILLNTIVSGLSFQQHTKEYGHDINNIERYQRRYDTIRKLTKRDFFLSMFFVFLSLGLLAFTNTITSLSFIWLLLIVFFILLALVFHQFVIQVKNLLA